MANDEELNRAFGSGLVLGALLVIGMAVIIAVVIAIAGGWR